ncbi:hypothetical protein [Chromobacterium subtsugae]|uniref:hypothetical protein n=1 Tax=Chromobacterium subtsugae TaxID=251747 RepID=UPI000A4E6A32|nr:hypothetical protein [Chromobacterium subtsugae]
MRVFFLICLFVFVLMGCANQNISLAQGGQGDLVNVSFVQANRSNTLGFSYELYRVSGERLHSDGADIYSRGGGGFGSYYAGGVFPKPGNKVIIRWQAYPIKMGLEEIERFPWQEKVVVVEGDEKSLKRPTIAAVMCSADEVHVRVFGFDEKWLEMADSSKVRPDAHPFRTLCKDGMDRE